MLPVSIFTPMSFVSKHRNIVTLEVSTSSDKVELTLKYKIFPEISQIFTIIHK